MSCGFWYLRLFNLELAHKIFPLEGEEQPTVSADICTGFTATATTISEDIATLGEKIEDVKTSVDKLVQPVTTPVEQTTTSVSVQPTVTTGTVEVVTIGTGN